MNEKDSLSEFVDEMSKSESVTATQKEILDSFTNGVELWVKGEDDKIPDELSDFLSGFSLKMQNLIKYTILRRLSKIPALLDTLESLEKIMSNPEKIAKLEIESARRVYQDLSRSVNDSLDYMRKMAVQKGLGEDKGGIYEEIMNLLMALPEGKLKDILEQLKAS